MINISYIFASDLDRTLIFSSKFDKPDNAVCVEYLNDQPVSYMTQEAYDLLPKLKNHLIPVTTRSLEQFKRVTPFQDCSLAITSNGGVILNRGEIFEPWSLRIKETLKHVDFDNILSDLQLENLFIKLNLPYDPRLVDGVFYYFKITEDTKSTIDNHLQTILPEDWHFTIQGVKLYILPKAVSKENALSYLIELMKPHCVFTAGDGKLDVNFLTLGDVIYSPVDSEAQTTLTQPHTIVSDTIYGGLEILQHVEREVLPHV